jgi:hypothetical protein
MMKYITCLFFFPKIFVSNYSQIFLGLILYNYCNCICIKLYENLIIRSHQVKVEFEIKDQIYKLTNEMLSNVVSFNGQTIFFYLYDVGFFRSTPGKVKPLIAHTNHRKDGKNDNLYQLVYSSMTLALILPLATTTVEMVRIILRYPRGYRTSKWVTCYNRSPKHHINGTIITFDGTNITYNSTFITLFSTFIHFTYNSTFITIMVPGTNIIYDGTLHHI